MVLLYRAIDSDVFACDNSKAVPGMHGPLAKKFDLGLAEKDEIYGRH
jgi:hypothetical protein